MEQVSEWTGRSVVGCPVERLAQPKEQMGEMGRDEILRYAQDDRRGKRV